MSPVETVAASAELATPAKPPAKHTGARFYRPELDAVRFLAFLLVFFHHGLPSAPISTLYGAAVSSLAYGLPLFFTLSAYLITTLLLKERERTGSVDLPRFYKRRALRIWPLYFGAIALSAIGAALHGNLHSTSTWFVAAVLMMGNLVTWQTTSVVHLWSISVEEQFYVFWPGLMRRLSKRSLALAAVGILVTANIVLARYGAMHADTWKRIWWSSLVQMEFFAAGILLALHDDGRSLRKLPLALRVAGFAMIVAAGYAATAVFRIKGPGQDALSPLMLCLGYAIVAACCGGLLYLVQGLDQWPKPIVYFGKISYGLYVFHDPALGLSHRLLGNAGVAATLAFALALTLLAGWLSYEFYETPFLRLKERFEVVKSRPVE